MEYSDMCQIPGFATMKLFRRELFDHIDFPEDYWFEDTIIHLNVFPKCKKGVVISETGYIYRQNDSGITQTRDGQARSLETVQVISKLKLKENYPDLKANQNFLDLQAQLEGTENRIAVERRKFNDVARSYNAFILQFPRNLVAGMFGFTSKPYFEANAGAENAPKVEF